MAKQIEHVFIQHRISQRHTKWQRRRTSRLSTEIDENEDEISDETIIINVIVTEPETLNEHQMKDENLFWVHTLKIEAMKRNEHKIIIEPKDLQIKNKEASTDNGIAFL